ncbi:peptidoglycan-binding domain-containing protein [Acidovorax sp. SUPP2539]|uniref:peptidoglycan-binding domain-containing protein n=1 Tax=Acidovorax sp. SUPP2539 TaxID=2920878 RepID=UPI0023DE6629|nr:peptidoglycan-binding domain-containing protein [Acidovorax sp. SUPP2539]GKS89625.1 peptidoglycan-binding protein [Acidovorax sp. SUPP2539]
MSKKTLPLLAAACAAVLLTGCETTNMKMGSAESKTVATGAAAGGATANESSDLQKCASPLGTVSLVENQQAGWYTILRNEYRLPPTANLLRLLIQQSNCFIVVERSASGMTAMDRERALMQSGEMRGGSNFGKGQMVASDYGLSPEIVFSNSDAGGIGGVLGGLIGGGSGRAIGALGGGLKTREASAMLTLVDNRSGVQISASEGSASKSDFAGFGSLFGGSAGGSLGGYQNTAQGKVLTAAFMDAYNQMVVALRNYKAQSVQGQGLGGGGRLGVDGGAAPSQTRAGVPAPAGAPAGAPAMSVREAQERLNALGYNVGTPDGAAGARTATALRNFQKSKGLPITGRVDAATADALSH